MGGSHLEAVVSPRAELHHARLFVERKIFDVDLAGRLVNRRRLPLDPTRVVQSRLRRQRHLEIAVGAVECVNRCHLPDPVALQHSHIETHTHTQTKRQTWLPSVVALLVV